MKLSITAIYGALIVVFLATLSIDAHAKCSFSVQGTRSYHRSAISYPSNCSGEAKAAIEKRLESILNVDYVDQSSTRGQIEKLAGQYASGHCTRQKILSLYLSKTYGKSAVQV
jgi:hypothetical protein